jgi:hypothetical protein
VTTIRASIIGLAKLQRALRKVNAQGTKGVQRAIAISGAQLQGEAQRLINRGPTRSGVDVIIGGKRHTRSAPGEPPKTDTGRLVGSIFAEFSNGGLDVDVGSDVAYAGILEDEFGTSKNRARPWLGPTFDANRGEITTRVRKAISEALRKAGRP